MEDNIRTGWLKKKTHARHSNTTHSFTQSHHSQPTQTQTYNNEQPTANTLVSLNSTSLLQSHLALVSLSSLNSRDSRKKIELWQTHSKIFCKEISNGWKDINEGFLNQQKWQCLSLSAFSILHEWLMLLTRMIMATPILMWSKTISPTAWEACSLLSSFCDADYILYKLLMLFLE